MKTFQRFSTTLAIMATCLMLSGMAKATNGDVLAQLSSRESYVGMPVTLYVQVSGSDTTEAPTIPEIDGLQIVQAGQPSRSSQISIINGRRTEHSSVTYAYRVTPRRSGIFQIPSIEVQTGQGIELTRPIRFSAATSETGDLMFAEVTGQQEKTFVGEPIDLTLKIWLKPYVDKEREIKLSAQNMWQTISNEQTEWGGFLEKLKNLQQNPEAVRVSEVLRADSEGIQRSYYLYEIDATIYPKAAGSLQAEDIQIVAQYPTALGKSRDPFDSFFANSPFANDSFFSSRGFSPFGSSLSVTSTRPIVVQPDVSSVEVAAIPTKGQPTDYRGAVGQYVLATQAAPTTVKAGDPISLTIGIRGTGPMELVQSPPLSQLNSLTADFKVSNEPLAGIVQDDVKVFNTTIRPRNEGIAQIPAIPFSFFDPDQEQFVTVYSNPIDITVNKADKLAIDSIVGAGGTLPAQGETNAPPKSKVSLENHSHSSLLTGSSTAGRTPWIWLLGIPPLLLLGFWLNRCRTNRTNDGGYRSTKSKINHAANAGTIAEAMRKFVQEKFGGQKHEFEGVLSCLYDDCNQAAFAGDATDSLDQLKTRAQTYARSMSRTKVSGRRNETSANSKSAMGRLAPIVGCASLVLLVVCTVNSSLWENSNSNGRQSDNKLNLNSSQQQALLKEANLAYQQGQQLSATDTAEAKQAFSKAADKYQNLVDSGIHHSKLYFNLGNTCLQIDSLGRAIANFHRAVELNPLDFQARYNLNAARKLAQPDTENASILSAAWWGQLTSNQTEGFYSVAWPLLGAVWLCFWGLLWIGMFRPTWKLPKTAIALGIGIAVLCGSMLATEHYTDPSPLAVIVIDDVAMHTGNGETFAELPSEDLLQGTAVQIIQRRGNWLQIRSSQGAEGWIHSDALEVV